LFHATYTAGKKINFSNPAVLLFTALFIDFHKVFAQEDKKWHDLGYNKIKSKLKDEPEASVSSKIFECIYKGKCVFWYSELHIMEAIYLYH
jgi:hypothetical protein